MPSIASDLTKVDLACTMTAIGNLKGYISGTECWIEENSQKDRILIASKTIWMLTLWHKTLVPALGS